MPEKPKTIATPRRLKRYVHIFGRIAATLLLLFMVAQAASAYTLVMRSGRQIKIPDNFNVTRLTLSYEAAPGISVTLQMSMIDIAATERLNNEPAGSLLRRAEGVGAAASTEKSAAAVVPSTPRSARRTITNRDLEALRRARMESEEAYERRRVALGLPSLEETRRRSEEETRKLTEQSRERDEEEAQSELYWRERATELRTETAVVDAEINYLRNQLARSQRTLTLSSYAVVTGALPRFPFRPRAGGLPLRGRWPPTLGATDTGARAVGVVGFGGGSTRGQVIVNTPGPVFHNFGRNNFGGRRGFPRPRAFVPPFGLYAQTLPVEDSSYDRSVLLTRLHELESVRAGLDARWRLLEDEARRAGALPGWLRP
ncbi:MAG TPA: hypothetical protein VM911_11150 [Pyrinomonadaceae bacterium]|jgi:hypothetical protein|nr:hypothetical protein [Pyrinomonadaceae bacterium]